MYLRELNRKCERVGCRGSAVVEIFNEEHKPIGRFCRKDGAQRLRHGSELELQKPPQPLTEAARR